MLVPMQACSLKDLRHLQLLLGKLQNSKLYVKAPKAATILQGRPITRLIVVVQRLLSTLPWRMLPTKDGSSLSAVSLRRFCMMPRMLPVHTLEKHNMGPLRIWILQVPRPTPKQELFNMKTSCYSRYWSNSSSIRWISKNLPEGWLSKRIYQWSR
jgi:hypothetical protein